MIRILVADERLFRAGVRLLLERAPTDREFTVLRLILAGRSNKEIAADLNITEGTVKTHVKHILDVEAGPMYFDETVTGVLKKS